ncbi:MAG: hypothetical protein WBL65_27485 [Bryobacteraceae bacterium]
MEIVALDRVFEIGVVNLLNAAAYNGLELLQPNECSPAVVSVRRFDNLDIPSDHVNQILLSPCPDQQSGRVAFVSDDTQKSVIEAEPHSTIVSNSLMRPLRNTRVRDSIRVWSLLEIHAK